MKPALVVVAGPNGAGKTTLSAENLTSAEIVNADEIARISEASLIDASRRAILERRRLLEAGYSFSFETTLSGRREFAFVRAAKSRRYRIELRYVAVETATLCRVRINERVARGGHDVPEADLLRRFERSFANLPHAISIADDSFIYDNSTQAGITLIALRRRIAARAGARGSALGAARAATVVAALAVSGRACAARPRASSRACSLAGR